MTLCPYDTQLLILSIKCCDIKVLQINTDLLASNNFYLKLFRQTLSYKHVHDIKMTREASSTTVCQQVLLDLG